MELGLEQSLTVAAYACFGRSSVKELSSAEVTGSTHYTAKQHVTSDE